MVNGSGTPLDKELLIFGPTEPVELNQTRMTILEILIPNKTVDSVI
jgi:hypothetical protein